MEFKVKGKVNYLPAATYSWVKGNYAEIDIDTEITAPKKKEINLPEGLYLVTEGQELCELVKKTSGMITGMDSLNIDSKAGDKDRLDNSDEDFAETLANYKKYANAASSGLIDGAIKAAGIKASALIAEKDTKVDEPVKVYYDENVSAVTDQIIYAKEGADINVVQIFSSNDDFDGLFGIRTKVYLEKGAHVKLTRVQLLGRKAIHFDDIAFYEEDNAQGELVQLELGANKAYVGVRTELIGYKADYQNDEAYLCRDDDFLDLNFVTNHSGKKTNCRMDTQGVLMDQSKKTYRGTIDFKEGSANSVGNETEATLLLSPDTVNKTVPLILCHEERVEGNHGATIGKVDEALLFYMKSRGIDEAAAKELMTRARINTVIERLPDEESKGTARHYIKGVFGSEL